MRLTIYKARGCASLAAMWLLAAAAAGQATTAAAPPYGLEAGQVPAVELGGHYSYFHANAPPGQCGCFGMNGGGGTIVLNGSRGISFVADLTGAHTNNVGGTSASGGGASGPAETLTILNVMGGARYSYRRMRRFTPYAEALLGQSLEYSNVPQASDKSALAASGGGGVMHTLGKYLGWQIVQADYVYSRLPNGKNDHQNNLRVSTGLFFRFGPD